MNCKRTAKQGKKWISYFLVMCMLISTFGFVPATAYAAGTGCDQSAEVLGENEEFFTAGDGSAGSPFVITNAKQLSHLRQHLDAKAVLTADINLGTAPFNTGNGWVPMGSNGKAFTGSLDGQGHIISGLTINELTGKLSGGAGLFGFVIGGSVKNIVLNNFDINVGYSNAKGWIPMGALVGCMRVGTIENIAAVSGTVKADVAVADGFVGGVLGHMGGVDGTASFKNITVHDVTVEKTGATAKQCSVGGALGTGAEGQSGNTTLDISNIVISGTTATATGAVAGTVDYVNPLSGFHPAGSDACYDITADKTHAAILAAGLGDLDAAAWGKEAGYYPILKAFNNNAAAMALLKIAVPTSSEPTCNHTTEELAGLNEEPFTAGDGSAASPFVITNAKQLNHLRQHMTANAVLTDDIDLAEFSSGDGWVPIGNAGAGGILFTGTLNGAGHVIKNLKINSSRIYDSKGVGLFGGASGAIKNLVLSDYSITYTCGGGWIGIGGLIGTFRQGTVENIAGVNGKITVTNAAKAKFTGGLIGHIGDKSKPDTQTIQNIFTDNVSVEVAGASTTKDVGGVIGTVDTESSGSNYTVKNIVVKDMHVTLNGVEKDNISGIAPAGTDGRYDITADETHAAILAAGLGDLDAAAWGKEAGYYPILKAFNNNAAAMTLLKNSAKIEGGVTPPAGNNSVAAIDETIFSGLMGTSTGYGSTNTLLKSEREKLAEGKKLTYATDNGSEYDLYYSSLLGAYVGYVPFAATKEEFEAHLQEKAGTAEIKYGIIGTGWDTGSRTAVEFTDLYYFDKVALYDTTLPNGQFQRTLAMDVNTSFDLDIADLYSLIYNYVLGTPFSKASN